MSKAIRSIQAQLQIDNYYNGVLDGLYGNKTDSAIKQAVADNKYKIYFNFDLYKRIFNRPSLTQEQVNSINGLFDAFNKFNLEGGTNLPYTAYMLATAYHETAHTMLPIEEYGKGKGRRYGSNIDINGSRYYGLDHLYYGRGYVQLTWLTNYIKMGLLLDIDLVNNPQRALEPFVAAQILVIGSIRGLFTGKGLGDYIHTNKRLNYINARRVINGTDKAQLIAVYAERFIDCLILESI